MRTRVKRFQNRRRRHEENLSPRAERHEVNALTSQLCRARGRLPRPPCAPGQVASGDGVHGVTRPTFAVHWQSLILLKFEPRHPGSYRVLKLALATLVIPINRLCACGLRIEPGGTFAGMSGRIIYGI